MNKIKALIKNSHLENQCGNQYNSKDSLNDKKSTKRKCEYYEKESSNKEEDCLKEKKLG